jgi:hypothetical protein
LVYCSDSVVCLVYCSDGVVCLVFHFFLYIIHL